MKITTIKLKNETKSRLEKLKEHKRETYDEIIKKLLWILNLIRLNPEKAEESLDRIDEMQKKMKEERKNNKQV